MNSSIAKTCMYPLCLPLLCLFMSSAAHAAPLTPDKFYAKVSPSVWRVVTYDADGIVFRQGSAVVIAKETLLTNCHVLAKAKRFAVKQDTASYDGKLQHVDVERDLCQIAVRNLPAPAVVVADSDQVVVGRKVYALGNPKGLELTLSDGLVSALRKNREGKLALIQTTAPFSQGSSGGGLFDEDGRLIGITTMIARDAQNLNFAVPINWLHELPARSEAALAKRRNPGAARQTAAMPEILPSQVFLADDGKSAETRPSAPTAAASIPINDVDKVPFLSEQGRAKYAEFLSKPLPRAFAINQKGGWSSAWSTTPPEGNNIRDPAIRALQHCEKTTQQRCYLYAVDHVVVYQPAQ